MKAQRTNYKDLLGSYRELKSFEVTFEGCKQQIITKANTAKQRGLPFVDGSVIWWGLNNEKTFASLLEVIGKKIRVNNGKWSIFHTLQGLYNLEKAMPSTFIESLKMLHRDFKKSKVAFDFHKLPTAYDFATAITEAKAKEKVAETRLKKANK